MPLRLLLLVSCLLLAGCYTFAPVTVQVRDRRTEAPVPGALVVIRALNMFDPVEYPHDLVNPSPGETARATTGADGSVRFEPGASCPGRIIVMAGDHEPHILSFDEHPADTGAATPWRPALPLRHEEPGESTIEVRLVP